MRTQDRDYRRFAFKLIRNLLTAACPLLVALGAEAATKRGVEAAPQVAVLLAPNDRSGLSAEMALAIFSGPPTRFDVADLHARAGRPFRIRFLLESRLSPEVRAGLREDDPLERMHHWLLLDYSSVLQARIAKDRILRERGPFKFAHQSVRGFEYSLAPSDPLFNYNNTVRDSSVAGTSAAAAYGALNIPSAWGSLQGNAHIGVLDNGVQTDDSESSSVPTTHIDLRQNLRRHFSRRLTDFSLDINEPEAIYDGHDYRGHGTHVTGLIAATPNNAHGSSGVCWFCSVTMVANPANEPEITDSSIAAGIVDTLTAGMQIFNWSGGIAHTQPTSEIPTGDAPNWYNENACASANVQPPICVALSVAESRQVVFVAASGNDRSFNDQDAHHPDPLPTQFPAKDPRVVSVGALAQDGGLWSKSSKGKVDFVAPGDRIFSTFYSGRRWTRLNDVDPYGPGTNCAAQSGNLADSLAKYGYCTGTSMSSPIIAGAFGLLRSANPLLSVDVVRSVMQQFASHAANPNTTTIGYGVPNVATALQHVLWGGMRNQGLTPLFSLYNPTTSSRHFYTSIPQMAAAASCGTLKIGPWGWRSHGFYVSTTLRNAAEGAPLANYPQFPGACSADAVPVASFRVFTTPMFETQNLRPLYRLSWNGETGPSTPSQRTSNVTHTYVTSATEFASLQPTFAFDGIEGYLFPPSIAKPAGTVGVYRRYNATLNDYGLFTESQLTTAGAGYTAVSGYEDLIGYACPTGRPRGVCGEVDVGQLASIFLLLLDDD